MQREDEASLHHGKCCIGENISFLEEEDDASTVLRDIARYV
jgi:hypothetical protein